MKIRNVIQAPGNLHQLQYLIKKDSVSYKDEFNVQLNHFKYVLQLFLSNPAEKNDEMVKLPIFLAQVAAFYSSDLANFPQEIVDTLEIYGMQMNSEIRLNLCKSLIILRNKKLIHPLPLHKAFFHLFKCQDKDLRSFLESFIITDIKNINKRRVDVKINSCLQSFLFSVLQDGNKVTSKISLLYKKNIWKNNKVVNMISLACFSPITKIMVIVLNFFLSVDKKLENSNTSDSDDSDISEKEQNCQLTKALSHSNKVNKNSRKRQKQLNRAKRIMKKIKTKEKQMSFNFSALHLINNPQEKLFQKLETMNERFEVKLMVLELISKLIGIHQLLLLNFYPFVQKLLQPHQREAAKILQFTAQACHSLVPPDSVEPVLKVLANNFITERNSSEVMAIGLNTVREICIRCPLAISEDLLHDLIHYKNYKERSVMMAARSLLQVFRDINPLMLRRKDRGRPTEWSSLIHCKKYGEFSDENFTLGINILEKNVTLMDEKTDKNGEYNSEHDSSNLKKLENVLGENDPNNEKNSILQTRLLHQEEFEQLDIAKVQMRLQKSTSKAKKRKNVNLEEDISSRGELVKLENIEMVYKKKKFDLPEKLLALQQKQINSSYVLARKPQRKHFSTSTTNREKLKNKNFSMVKHKVKMKQKDSFRDKQMRFRNALSKMKRKLMKM